MGTCDGCVGVCSSDLAFFFFFFSDVIVPCIMQTIQHTASAVLQDVCATGVVDPEQV